MFQHAKSVDLEVPMAVEKPKDTSKATEIKIDKIVHGV